MVLVLFRGGGGRKGEARQPHSIRGGEGGDTQNHSLPLSLPTPAVARHHHDDFLKK